MIDTIFGKIIRGEIPATKVYEDEKFLAFMDINPVRKGHVLILPKEAFVWFQEVPDETLMEIVVLAKRIANAMKDALGLDYIQVVVEGVEVPHFHIHLMPGKNGEKNAKWHHEIYEEGEKEIYAEKIKNSL